MKTIYRAILIALCLCIGLGNGAFAFTDAQRKDLELRTFYDPTDTATSCSAAGQTDFATPGGTIDQQIAQSFIVGFDTSTPQATIEGIVQKYKIGGIFILGKGAAGTFNKPFIDKLNTAAGTPLVVSSDEEGTAIHRYDYSFNFPNAFEMSKLSDAQVEAIGKKVAQSLAANGVNTDLAPVLDVATDNNGTDATTAQRAFSNNPGVVTSKARAFAKGLRSGGVNPVFKHFPGIGGIKGNTDKQLLTSPPLASLKAKDLLPYKSLANQSGAAVMMNNAIVPGLTKGNDVAGTSADAVSLLRNDYGFTGLITTDDLAVSSAPTSLPESIAKALKAGVDMPLFKFTSEADIQAAIDKVKANNTPMGGALSHIASFKGIPVAPASTSVAGAAQAAVAAVSPAPTPNPSATTTGSVYVIGDSIAAGTIPELTTALKAKGFSSVTINAKSSRRLSTGSTDLDGLSVLSKDKAAWSSADTIIIELGTNNGLTAASIDSTLAVLKGVKAKIYWVNIGIDNAKRSKPINAEPYNAALTAGASKGYTVIDWASVVKAHPEYILDGTAGLGVHPYTATGKPGFANTVASGLSASSTPTAPVATEGCVGAFSAIGSAAATVLSGSSNAQQIFNFFKGKGLSAIQAAAIMGNIQAESGFRSDIIQGGATAPTNYSPKNGVGFGLAQWTFDSRQKPLVALAAQQGKSVTDLRVQLDYLWQELSTGYKGSTLEPLMTATSLEVAVGIVLNNFEAPKERVQNQIRRTGFAQNILAQAWAK